MVLYLACEMKDLKFSVRDIDITLFWTWCRVIWPYIRLRCVTSQRFVRRHSVNAGFVQWVTWKPRRLFKRRTWIK